MSIEVDLFLYFIHRLFNICMISACTSAKILLIRTVSVSGSHICGDICLGYVF